MSSKKAHFLEAQIKLGHKLTEELGIPISYHMQHTTSKEMQPPKKLPFKKSLLITSFSFLKIHSSFSAS